MPRSEGTAAPPADLLHDLGGAVVRSAAGDVRTEELMRLATDPLLLRALLSRIERPEREVWGKPAVLPPLTSTPSPRMPVPIQAGYARRDAVLEPSLFPERFEASAEDWSEALVVGGMAEPPGAGLIASLLASVGVALGLLGLFLILSV